MILLEAGASQTSIPARGRFSSLDWNAGIASIEKILDLDETKRYRLFTCEEAYHQVAVTENFITALSRSFIPTRAWYAQQDPERTLPSYIPPERFAEARGVFVYYNIADLDKISSYFTFKVQTPLVLLVQDVYSNDTAVETELSGFKPRQMRGHQNRHQSSDPSSPKEKIRLYRDTKYLLDGVMVGDTANNVKFVRLVKLRSEYTAFLAARRRSAAIIISFITSQVHPGYVSAL
ncbi:hypothetical protein OG21DRAFT_1603164 [Imleria badia]|nr:hypothetical protein OG21DRAFT_1603164 [Imleria badia]